MTDISKCQITEAKRILAHMKRFEPLTDVGRDALQTCLTILDEYEKMKGKNEDLKDLLLTRDSYIEELKSYRVESDVRGKCIDKLKSDRDRLQSIVRELRGAMEGIATSDSHVFDEDPCGQLDYVMDIAKQVLERNK